MVIGSGLRRTVIWAAAAALALLVVRNAAVWALVERDPATARALWPGHPAVEIARASSQIADAAGAQKPIGRDAFAVLGDAARKAPLEPQPFIVRGIQLQLAGQSAEADRAFLAARWRDPRSLPARYFLASTRLARRNVEGLREVAALSRLSPGGTITTAPYLAAFARQKQAWGPMRAMFRDNPAIRSEVLATLAQDPANLREVVVLGGTVDPVQAPWLAIMIRSLVEDRQFARAQGLWARTVGIAPSVRPPLLFDPDFRDSAALPPFNWELTSSAIGLAERRSGRLQVIYYGQADGILARQLLVLPAGRYRFAAPAKGAVGEGGEPALTWTARCAGASPAAVLASAPASAQGLSFDVPQSCTAQWLELGGSSSDMGRESEISIGRVALSRVAER